MHCCSIRALERDGLEGSFGIFGLWASLAGMPNVPESEEMNVAVDWNTLDFVEQRFLFRFSIR